jgi:6-phosphogluconolactonase (cycloisomerase 2 family)
MTVTGVSGSTAETTTVCADVSSTGATCAATATTSGNFYILNNGTPAEIVGESLVSGALTSISGSPWSLSGLGTPYSMAIAPDGNFLYVSTESGVYLFPIANGALGTGVAVDQQDLSAYAIQVDPSSSWLVEAVHTTGGVVMNAINIDPTSGAVVSGVSVGTASYVYPTSSASVQKGQLVISQDEKYAFVALGTGGTAVFPFNTTSGFATGTQAIAHVSPVHSGGGALSVAVDPSATPRMFYVGESLANSAGNGGALRAFIYSTIGNTAGLSQATGSPIATGGTAPNFILPVASPDYIYVAAGASAAGNIASFAVSTSGATYSLAAGPTTAVGVQPVGLAEDATGSFLLEVGSLGSPYFDSFTFDAATTGKLDTVVSSSTQASSIAIVAAPPAQ